MLYDTLFNITKSFHIPVEEIYEHPSRALWCLTVPEMLKGFHCLDTKHVKSWRSPIIVECLFYKKFDDRPYLQKSPYSIQVLETKLLGENVIQRYTNLQFNIDYYKLAWVCLYKEALMVKQVL